jgi:hypothetical protein
MVDVSLSGDAVESGVVVWAIMVCVFWCIDGDGLENSGGCSPFEMTLQAQSEIPMEKNKKERNILLNFIVSISPTQAAHSKRRQLSCDHSFTL